MRITPCTAVVAILLALLAAPVQAQTCTNPWTPAHNVVAPFEVGKFYRSPYTEVIEVLAKVCVSYDEVFDEDTGAIRRQCGAYQLALRNVQGRGLLSTPRYLVVYYDGQRFAFPAAYVPTDTPIGTWGKLPEGCYRRSVVIAIEDGNLVFTRLITGTP